MKNLSVLLTLTMVVASCVNKKEAAYEKRNDLLPQHVYVVYPVMFENKDIPEWTEGIRKEAVLEKTEKAIREKKIRIFKDQLFNPKFLSKMNEYDTAEITDRLMPKIINGMVFAEEWMFDKKSLKMEKRAIAQGPLIPFKLEGYDEVMMKILFWMLPDTTIKNEENIIIKNITYETHVNRMQQYNFSMENLADILFEAVINDSVAAYDFFSGEILTKEKIKERCSFGSEENISDEDFLRAISYNEIKGILFTEDWYMSEKDFMMRKEVKSIALIREYFPESDSLQEETRRIPIFKIKMNE